MKDEERARFINRIANLESSKYLRKRYDSVMQRRRDPMCCNDFPECHHGR